MRQVCACLLFVSLAQITFAQQKYPRAEVFGGYSYLHIDTQGVTGSTLDSLCNGLLGAGSCPAGTFRVHNGFNGWNTAAQGNFNRWFGVAADFSGHYGTPVTLSSQAQAALLSAGITIALPKTKSYSYLFGPVISSRNDRFTLFGHALFGVNNVSAAINSGSISGLAIPSLTESDTAFAGAFGGGADSRIANHLALRVQADYLLTKHDFSGGAQGIASHQNNIRVSAGIVYRFGKMEHGNTEPSQTASRAPGTGMLIPVLGVRVAIGSNQGAEITDEAPNGLAALAGLHSGDVINAVDGKPVRTSMELVEELSNRVAGDKVRLSYLLHGQWQSETVVILQSH